MFRVLLLLCLLMMAASPAYADEPPPDEDVAAARAAFSEGAELASQMLWGEALARFEKSAAIKAHAGTTYNIGICLRALGSYTRAHAAFEKALAEHAVSNDEELAESTVSSIRGYLAETDRVLGRIAVTLSPSTATITVDGRPLELADDGSMIAGTAPTGPGRTPPKAKFTMVLDPGAHVFIISRKGFTDAVISRNVAPGSRSKLTLKLERLPATLVVSASETEAAVSVDGIDVGLAPSTVQRPPGDYEVLVQKRGFDAYRADVTLRAAERIDLMAQLNPIEVGLHERWWFWAALGTAVAATVVVTYAVTRPEQERPALNGGGLGWTIRVP